MDFLVGLKVTAGLQTDTVGVARQHGARGLDTRTPQSAPVHGELPQGGKKTVRCRQVARHGFRQHAASVRRQH
jgi:hypothetical protein